MRLTLRTLLAYLDDVLPPAETREIGKKVQESPIAAALVSRIREAMRRRRLGAPDVDGAGMGIDPNIVAQYLDNTLPADRISEIERVFIDSDVQLAEVAACHQILTQSQAQPLEITTTHRERLYVLGSVDPGDQLQTAIESEFRSNGQKDQSSPLMVMPVDGSAGQSFEESLPEALRVKPWFGRVLTAAILVAAVGIWLGVVLIDPSLRGTRVTSSSKVDRNAAETADAKDTPRAEDMAAVESDSAVPAAPKEPPPKTPDEQPAPTEVVVSDTAPADAAPPPEVDAKPAETVATTEPEVPAPPVPDAPPLLPPANIQYVSLEGVLLHQEPAKDRNWYVLPKKSGLKAGTVLASPEPFESVVEFDGGALRVTLLGETVVELTGPTSEVSGGLHLISGRIILNAGQRTDGSLRLALTNGHQAGILEIPADAGDTTAGIEYLPVKPVAFEEPVSAGARVAGIYVVQGGVVWSGPGGQPRAAGHGEFLNLTSDQPALAYGAEGQTPDWLDPQRRKASSPLRRFAALFDKEFEEQQPIDSSMLALLRNPKWYMTELAVRCLALTENIGGVVQAMAQTEHEEARKAATNGLQLWLGLRPDRGPVLRSALEQHYEPPYDVDSLYRLLWGFSEAEARQETPSLDLVEMLRSNRVEIRELAFENLVRLTGRKYDYRPLANAGQRESAIRRWLEHIERDRALVKPE